MVMKQMKITQLAVLLGMGLFMVACGGGEGEGPIVPPPPAPAEYADKHMPAGWWADAAKMEEGRKLFIGETNPDVNCASCHGKDGKPVKAGQVADVTLLYAYQSPVSHNLFIVAGARSHDGEVELSNAYSATYRDPSGRQFTASDATTPTTLRPNSTATFALAFPAPAKIGGTVHLEYYDKAYNTLPVELSTN